MIPEVAELLAEHLRRHPASGDDLVFTTPRDGTPIKNSYASAFVKAARKVGLPEHTSQHDLRHFYASLLIREGCSVKVVQARLGHATAAETLDTYAHLWSDDDDRTRRAVTSGLNGLLSGGRQ